MGPIGTPSFRCQSRHCQLLRGWPRVNCRIRTRGRLRSSIVEPARRIESVVPRKRADISAAALAVQANVVSLWVSCRRRNAPDAAREAIRTPPPGPVRMFREILIDHRVIKSMSDAEVAMRLRQVWGEFSALCWVFRHDDPHCPPSFDKLPTDQAMRCPGELQSKLDELLFGLWRIRHERQARAGLDTSDLSFRREREIALSRPMRVFGVDIGSCDAGELFWAACEYAGMLASSRWTIDDRWAWEGPKIMETRIGADQSG